MPGAWPRNIIPYDEPKLRALATVEGVALHLAAIDGAVREADLTPAELALARDIIDAGLLAVEDGYLVPTVRHHRDPDGDIAGRFEHKQAKVAYAEKVIAEAKQELASGGAAAHVAIGIVTFPDTPEAVAEANAIIAEAEDQLRALAETAAPDHGKKVRVMLFVGSIPS